MFVSESTTYHINSPENNITQILHNIKKYEYVSLLKINIPKSFYQINSTNNTFIFSEDTTDFTITIPQGNYSSIQFANMVKKQLNAVCTNVYNLYFDPEVDNGILIFHKTSGVISPINITIDNLSTGRLFGLNVGTHTFSGDYLYG